MVIKDYRCFHQMFREAATKHGEITSCRWFNDAGGFTSITYDRFRKQVAAVSKSLLALGIGKADKIGVLSYTCFRWLLCDLAIMKIGAVTVGIYQSNTAEECDYIIRHADAVLLFVENREQLEKIRTTNGTADRVKKIVLFEGDVQETDQVLSFNAFLQQGHQISEKTVQTRTDEVRASDTAAIVYTSGTTGSPKGVVLTHDNLIFTAQSAWESGNYKIVRRLLMFLPLAHIYARMCCYVAILAGHETTFSRGFNSLIDDFKLAAPDWFPSVPRVFEKIYISVLNEIDRKPKLIKKLFKRASDIGAAVGYHKMSKEPAPFVLTVTNAVLSALFFSKIRKAMGGKVQFSINGGAPLNPTIGKFFHCLGIPILEGLGMTETTSFSNINRSNNYQFGVVGPPGIGIQQRIASDGEVLFRGRNVMKAYYKMADQTKQQFTKDGWLKSDDIGEIGADDVLRIVGRKKEIIITSGGKNISPARIESLIATSPYIYQACLVGDGRQYLTALLTVDQNEIKKHFDQSTNGPSHSREPFFSKQIVALVNEEIRKVNDRLSSFETLKQFAIVPPFTVDNNMMTPTFKLKKENIYRRYRQEIDRLYP